MIVETSLDFARVFSDAVADATRRLGKLKKELAHDCEMRPDRFSHLQSGVRRPGNRDTVLKIAKGLRLDEPAANRLLQAAGFPPLREQQGTAALVSRLGEPDRTIVQSEVEKDIELIHQAWDYYVSVQSHNEAREWVDAGNLFEKGLDQYWQLRAAAARFLAQVYLNEAESRYYLNNLDEAESLCREGLGAAGAADSRMFQVMLLGRLASIKRLRSDYEGATGHYEDALRVLSEWERGDGGVEPARPAWRGHWRGRIQRMQGTLELFKGQPGEAIKKLKPSLDYFTQAQNGYELSQACYGLGWAHSLLGDHEAAMSWYVQGMEHALAHGRLRGREDQRTLLQGHLYLGSTHLEMGDVEKARRELDQALLIANGPLLTQYQEVGRVHQMLGKLHLATRSWELARHHSEVALEFFSHRDERTQLAQAHNSLGDFHLARGGPAHVERALRHYRHSLEAARSCRPPNAYYECAALFNICNTLVRSGLPAAELGERRDAALGVDATWDVDGLIERARAIGVEHHYRNHLARLAVVEAEWALRRGQRGRCDRSAADALHLSHNFSPHLHREVRAQLEALHMPAALLDAPLVVEDRAPASPS